jgi:hypothetical protein
MIKLVINTAYFQLNRLRTGLFLKPGLPHFFCLSWFLFLSTPVYLQKNYSEPASKIIIESWDESYDQVYSIGWDKKGNYYAYLAVGYIDGAVDGLTARLYILNTTHQMVEKKITAYTSYDHPVADIWTTHQTQIQEYLHQYRIIAYTGVAQLYPMPVTNLQKDSIPIIIETNDTLVTIQARLLKGPVIRQMPMHAETITCLGWMPCPYNKNKVVVFTSANIYSCENYITGFLLNLGKR